MSSRYFSPTASIRVLTFFSSLAIDPSSCITPPAYSMFSSFDTPSRSASLRRAVDADEPKVPLSESYPLIAVSRPGTTVIKSLPKSLICWLTCLFTPSPSAIIVVTDMTPIIIPSSVKKVRILLLRRELTAILACCIIIRLLQFVAELRGKSYELRCFSFFRTLSILLNLLLSF